MFLERKSTPTVGCGNKEGTSWEGVKEEEMYWWMMEVLPVDWSPRRTSFSLKRFEMVVEDFDILII